MIFLYGSKNFLFLLRYVTVFIVLEILPRAQQKEDLLITVHVPTTLDAVSVSFFQIIVMSPSPISIVPCGT